MIDFLETAVWGVKSRDVEEAWSIFDLQGNYLCALTEDGFREEIDHRAELLDANLNANWCDVGSVVHFYMLARGRSVYRKDVREFQDNRDWQAFKNYAIKARHDGLFWVLDLHKNPVFDIKQIADDALVEGLCKEFGVPFDKNAWEIKFR